MAKRRYTAEEIVTVLRQVEVAIANGKTAPQACRESEISEQTYYRWRKEYGGLKLEQAVNGIYGPNFAPATSPAIGKSNMSLGAVDPIATWKPSFIPNLTLQTEYLYASQDGPVVNGHSGTWQALAQYLVYDFTPSLESATRAEFFQDKDGARTGTSQTLWEIT